MRVAIGTSLLPFGVVTALFLLGPTAKAMCVYNDMDTEIEAILSVSTFRGSAWRLGAGDYACYPNAGGELYSQFYDPVRDRETSLYDVNVDPHGYAVLYTISGAERGVCVYSSDDVEQTCQPFAAAYPSSQR